MNRETEKNINKDLILRERLALERTEMANDRTLLAFFRTALYLFIAGITINSFLRLKYGLLLEIVFVILSLAVLIFGIVKYKQQKKRLIGNEKHIGDFKLDYEK